MTRNTLFTALALTTGLAVTAFVLTSSNSTQSGNVAGGMTQRDTTPSSLMAVQAAETTATMEAGPLDQMAQKLKDRLQNEPDDMEGWVLLGRTYQYMNNQAAADEAYAKATALGLAPARLAEIRSGMAAKTPAQPSRVFPEPKTSRNLTAVMIDQALKDSPDKAQASVSGSVNITPELAQQLNNKNATLFIFARADKGPPMPLAAIRQTPAKLPFSFTLNDSNAVIPDRKLSSATAVVIGARISFSDSATATPGDLEGFSQTIDPTAGNNVTIEINQIRQ
ncbi:c-type cytochrome biogenesis protein CcmI/CycH [Amphritea sp.]|uniref:c-type cytochrome biogenesis protein CcmI/CycH n=1 Tax=Amphritea sp. TaxID=1872502 RepID=UPI003D13ADE2